MFIQQISHLCKENQLLLIVDEVQTGIGRTGKLFAYEHYGIAPDIITLAKGLGSGFPIGAMLGKEKLKAAFSAGSHGSTFGGSPLATIAALATIETILEERVSERAEKMGKYLQQRLKEELAQYKFVKEVRGIGLLIGIEFTEPVFEIITSLYQNGLLVISGGPNVIRLLPSLYVTDKEIDEFIDILCHVLSDR